VNDLSFLRSWLHARNPVGTTDREHEKLIEEFEQFFDYIFNNSKDGISILDPDLTILGVNSSLESWYSHRKPLVGKKCHKCYHDRAEPCENCPSLVAIRSGRPQVGLASYEAPGGGKGTQELSVFPLFDNRRILFGVIEYVRDITDLNEEARVIENLKRRIQFQDQTLAEQETALDVLLKRGDKAERRLAGEIMDNISSLVEPAVERLKRKFPEAGASAEMALLESRLRDIAAPLVGRLALAQCGLTRREEEIASLVLEGKSSKEISVLLCVSSRAVDFHRLNIRKKLRLDNPDVNLRSFLAGVAG
jgi:hypothetical protein